MGRPPPLHPDTFTAMNTVALHILLECDLCPQRCASSVGEPSRPSPAASPPAGPGLESRPRPRPGAKPAPSSPLRSPLSPAALLVVSAARPGPPPAPAAHARSAAARPTGHGPRRPPRPAPFSEPHGFLQPLRLRVLSIQHSRPRGHGQMPPAVLQHPSSPPPVTTDPLPTRFARDADTWTHECVSQGPAATRRSPASGMSPALRNAVYDLLSETTHLRSGA